MGCLKTKNEPLMYNGKKNMKKNLPRVSFIRKLSALL
jgi:hypothetical protein